MDNMNLPGNGSLPDLAWMMFAQNGNPGFYMLYHDMLNGDEREEDERLR